MARCGDPPADIMGSNTCGQQFYVAQQLAVWQKWTEGNHIELYLTSEYVSCLLQRRQDFNVQEF